MELFKFTFTSDPTILEQGRMITDYTSAMWVERYAECGEFEIQALLSSGLREFLPIATLISHADTYEVMIVENHEINEGKDSDPVITISGRSFDSWLEQRIIGINQARQAQLITEFILLSNYTWNQIVVLINDHILNTFSVNDQLGNVIAIAETIAIGSSTQVARTIARGDLYRQVVELLAIDDLGLKTIRRNTFGVVGSSTQTVFSIFRGANKSATVSFSWKAGDLDNAEYLFSNKKYKNSALVQGRYVNATAGFGINKYDKRMMFIDASDIDGNLSAPPTGQALTDIVTKMGNRGLQVLLSQPNVTITRTDISETSQYRYRRDYNIGDLVSLDGNFGQAQIMRVVEYVEIEDENGASGHPTLSIPGVIA
jgi:hypothetical protein